MKKKKSQEEIQPKTVILRLITGEDIIAQTYEFEQSKKDSAHFIVVEPLRIIYMVGKDEDGDEAVKIKLTQWVFRNMVDSQSFKIYTDDVLTTIEPKASLIEAYIQVIKMLLGYDSEIESSNEETETETESKTYLSDSKQKALEDFRLDVDNSKKVKH